MEKLHSKTIWQSLLSKIRHVRLKEFDYNIHISLKNQLMYVETPKVACSTIKLTLAKLELEDVDYFREDIHDRYLSPLIRPSQVGDFDKFLKRPDLVKFCFVRNPYERLLSSYLNKVGGRNEIIYTNLLCQLGLDQTDFSREISFAEFVSCVEQTPVSMMDSHWRPQYYQTFQESLDYDLVGRLENFEDDMRTLEKMISRDLSPYMSSWTLHQTNSKDRFSEYYDDDLLERVYELYRVDFEAFGYSPELPIA